MVFSHGLFLLVERIVMKDVRISRSVRRNWKVNNKAVFQSVYRFDAGQKIFKFCYQPNIGELLFDVPGVHHNMIILNQGIMEFDDYVRGICFWDKKIIYLRGHKNEAWLRLTRRMLRDNSLPANYRIIWGKEAAKELAKDLEGL